ncbi:heavy-metal-associated domain-containing protein [Sulfurimonas sp. MAG313]|nr:heavy-metal-associated domain-containing protein [Sulfurimonas sp. MAG313]MDF1880188.1 heavy-metal-associated domain-containing protein [Sulfurimonas sp. MAG313]
MTTLQVENVKCGGCASTLTSKLKEEFGEIEVNLETHPREIMLEIDEDKMPALTLALRSLGYPLSTDELGLMQTASTKAKSFVSCAVGKIDNFKEA